MSSKPLMHVKCSLCNARTWFTEQQWSALPVGEIINPHVVEHVEEPKPNFGPLDRRGSGE